MFLFYTPWKRQKTTGFLTYSGGYRKPIDAKRANELEGFTIFQFVNPFTLMSDCYTPEIFRKSVLTFSWGIEMGDWGEWFDMLISVSYLESKIERW